MKYHVIPTAKLDRNTPNDLKPLCSEAINEMSAILKKLIKKADGKEQYKDFFYLYDEKSVDSLFEKLKPGDEVVIHAEGNPWIIGLGAESPFDTRAYQLAELFATQLKDKNKTDMNLNINLIACNSATQYDANTNYAKDTSSALGHVFHCNNVTVSGYTGYMNVKDNGKFSVSDIILGAGQKGGAHASMDDARVVFKNGQEIKRTRSDLAHLSRIAYSYMDGFKILCANDQSIVRRAIQNNIRSELNQLRQSPSASSENVDEQRPANNSGM